jgi:hypothetical protein
MQIGGLQPRYTSVYASVRNVPAEVIAAPAARSSRRRIAVSRTVILLGLVSLFTDLSQEMVTAVLPLYLTYQVRLSPLQSGTGRRRCASSASSRWAARGWGRRPCCSSTAWARASAPPRATR